MTPARSRQQALKRPVVDLARDPKAFVDDRNSGEFHYKGEPSCFAAKTPSQRVPRGITLVETALATFFVGILVCAALQSMGSSLQTHAFAKSRVQAVLLAEQLLAELSTMSWCEEGQSPPVIGRETGETTAIVRRNQLDDMDDFDGWTEAPSKRDGTALTGTSGITRTVTINNVSASDLVTSVADNADSGLRLITVIVSDSSGELARSSTLLSRAESGLRASRLEQRSVPND